jgi:hypothetical protein
MTSSPVDVVGLSAANITSAKSSGAYQREVKLAERQYRYEKKVQNRMEEADGKATTAHDDHADD